jgi:hypothetical protein
MKSATHRPPARWSSLSRVAIGGVGHQVYRMKLDGTDTRWLTSTGRRAININDL